MDVREKLISDRILTTRGLPLKTDIDTIRKLLEEKTNSELQKILYTTQYRKRNRYEEIRLKIVVKILNHRRFEDETEVTCCCS